jgi:hypothetical protein
MSSIRRNDILFLLIVLVVLSVLVTERKTVVSYLVPERKTVVSNFHEVDKEEKPKALLMNNVTNFTHHPETSSSLATERKIVVSSLHEVDKEEKPKALLVNNVTNFTHYPETSSSLDNVSSIEGRTMMTRNTTRRRSSKQHPKFKGHPKKFKGHPKFRGLNPRIYPYNQKLEKYYTYSLGDLVRGAQSMYARDHKNHKSQVCRWFPHSLGCRYLSSPDYSQNNLTLLCSLVDDLVSDKGYALPDPSTTVVHIRIGDVVDPDQTEPPQTDDCFQTKCIYRINRRRYTYPRSYYECLLKEGLLRPPNETSIEIVGFLYHRHSNVLRRRMFQASHDYRNNVTSFFQSAGYATRNLGDREPDHDFAYLTHAKTIVPGGGGFGKLIAELVQRNGGSSVECTTNW